MKRIAIFVVLALSMVGCSITPPITETENKAARLSTTVATPGVDGVAVTAAVLDFQEIDPKTGENLGIWKRTVHIYNSLPLGGELLKATVGAVVPAFIQGQAVKAVAEIGKCADGGNCGTVINTMSGSVSGSTSQVKVDVSASAGGACNTLACTGK